MNQEILEALKQFNWQTIIDYGQSLEDLNDRQWRFLKGLVVELTIEKNAVDGLVYVGQDHCDFVWPKYNVTVELKSQLSGPLYGKRGGIAKQISIKLNNSNGTNKQIALDPQQVADILIVVRNNGVFALTKDTVLKTAYCGGDGWEVRLDRDLHLSEIYLLSGAVTRHTVYQSKLKEKVLDAIRQEIPGPKVL